MELECAWKPDFCCGRDKHGGVFDVLGNNEEESGSEEEEYEDDKNEDVTIDDGDIALDEEHQHTSRRRTSQDSNGSSSRMPRGSLRWLRQNVPEYTLRHIESLLNHLHTGSNPEQSKDDKIGVLHLPSPFHRAILHAICRWWGASSRSEYRRNVRRIHSHVVADEEEDMLGGAKSANGSLHRVTVIGRGKMPEVFLADRIFGSVNDMRGSEGEG